MSESFKCSICGAEHGGLTTDWAYALPDEVWTIPEAERSARAHYTPDLCKLEERYFMRCLLEIPFTDTAGNFGWGAWAEVALPTFQRYYELYHEDGSGEPPMAGNLANELPAYPGMIGASVVIQLRDASKRPLLLLPATDQTLLAREQRDGIDSLRYHEILSIIASRRT